MTKKDMDTIKWLWKDENKIAWIQSFLTIVDKCGKTVKFLLTQEQKDFVNGLSSENIISKSRQLGLSSIAIALSIRQCIIYPNSSCLLASHDQKSCNAIFDKLKQQFNSLPNFIKPKTIANNRAEIKMINGSKITCNVAGNIPIGRGSTYSLVHLSEFAFFKNADKHLNSITQAMGSNSTLIIESTSNGVNLFHDLYFASKNKENSFKCFFFNWINGGTLFKEKYIESVKRYKAIYNKDLELEDLDEEEKDLIKIGASYPQLTWRRMTISKTSLEEFHQEYPSTDIESFLMTGSSVFDNRRVSEAIMAIKANKTKPLDKKSITDLPIILKNLYGKSLFMWDIPKVGMKYSIGCDLSEGLGQDYHDIEIYDNDMVQVGQFYNNKIKPYEMAEIINELGRYFNKALLCIERASGGLSVIERLRMDYKYMNMMKYKSFDEFNRPKMTIGFDTNAKTKSLIINDFLELFDKKLMVIKSERTLGEMQTFVAKDNKMGAINGSHDDSVVSTALCIQAHKQKFQYKW